MFTCFPIKISISYANKSLTLALCFQVPDRPSVDADSQALHQEQGVASLHRGMETLPEDRTSPHQVLASFYAPPLWWGI